MVIHCSTLYSSVKCGHVEWCIYKWRVENHSAVSQSTAVFHKIVFSGSFENYRRKI